MPVRVPLNINAEKQCEFLYEPYQAPTDGRPILVFRKGRKDPSIASFNKARKSFEFDCGTTVVWEQMAGWFPCPYLLKPKSIKTYSDVWPTKPEDGLVVWR